MLYLCLIILLLNDIEIYRALSTESNEDFIFPMRFNLEKQLKNKFAQKMRSANKFRRLNDHIAKDTEYFEEIPHFLAISSKKIKSKQRKIEHNFKNIIGMVGFKYTYRRDFYWRTWREITDGDQTKVICYRCQNVIYPTKNNCTNCNSGGYWLIEERRPSCSYEIFSFKKNNLLCVANFWELHKTNISACPAVIPYDDISECNDKIITKYLITKDYSKNVSERTSPVICQGREYCDISTVYSVTPEKIIFRIINTTNNIIYSRIMKHNGNNYVCVEDCGIFNYATNIAEKNEDHLILDLLNPIKQKRHNAKQNKTKETAKKDELDNDQSKYPIENKSLIVEKYKYILEKPLDRKQRDQQKTTCKRILLNKLFD